MSLNQNIFNDKTILVTGGVGSIGKEIVKRLLEFDIRAVRALDINETELFYLEQNTNHSNLRTFIGDVRDKDRLRMAIQDVDIVFHAAALKHVPLCEYNPFEAIKTNVLGTQNLIDVSLDEGIDQFIFISTDKAVNPINVMGTTKLLAERLTTSANYYKGSKKCIFSSVRFGNVLGSRGSIIPLLKKQIEENDFITITHKDMSRFVMSIDDAVNFVIQATAFAKGGEVFISKMPAIKVTDLAEVIIEEYSPKIAKNAKDIRVKIIGNRPGEKMFEELLTEQESKTAIELNNMFVLLPSHLLDDLEKYHKDSKMIEVSGYTSRDISPLSKHEIKMMIASIL